MSRQPLGAYDPELRRKNIRLGLTIGLLFILLLVAALVKFALHGLPVGKSEHNHDEQRASGMAPLQAPERIETRVVEGETHE